MSSAVASLQPLHKQLQQRCRVRGPARRKASRDVTFERSRGNRSAQVGEVNRDFSTFGLKGGSSVTSREGLPWHESDAAKVQAMTAWSNARQSKGRRKAALSGAQSAIKAKTAAHTSRGMKQAISGLLAQHAKGKKFALDPAELADLKEARELWKKKKKTLVSKHKYTKANIKAERERVANDAESESEPLLEISLDRLLDDKQKALYADLRSMQY
jgi:hypothetical protein